MSFPNHRLAEKTKEIKKPGAILLAAGACLWLGLALFGLARLEAFGGAAGKAGHPPIQWRSIQWRQAGASLAPPALDASKPTLIMLVHPQCPCSRASIFELNRLIALCPNQAKISVLFLRPVGYPVSWTKAELWRQASALPGVRVQVDDSGAFARRFGAATSGETLLYAPDGHLLYQGGLTGARGHEGDNAGLLAVAAILQSRTGASVQKPGTAQKSSAVQEPVYGCPMTVNRT